MKTEQGEVMKVVILHYQEGEKKDVALSFVPFRTNIKSCEAAASSQGNCWTI